MLVQAGSSEDGRDFAARHAEAIFTAQQTLADAQAFYADIKARAAAFGRDPEQLRCCRASCPAIGSTEAEAQALEEELDRLIQPEYAREQLAAHPAGRPGAAGPRRAAARRPASEDAIEGAKPRYTLIVTLARRERLTVRELIGRLGGGRGHRTFIGTPEQVADAIEEWFDQRRRRRLQRDAAGATGGLEAFVDHVVPILQARGLFRHRVRRHDPARALRPATGPASQYSPTARIRHHQEIA